MAERVRDPEMAIEQGFLQKLPSFHRVMYILGFAVFASQIFEAIFVLVARTAFRHSDAKRMSEIAPFSIYAHKQPISALVRELSEKSQIHQGLADRISTLVFERNILVHRIVIGEQQVNEELMAQPVKPEFATLLDQLGGRSGLTSDPFSQHAAMIEVGKRVYRESIKLTVELLNEFAAYCERFPEAAEFVERYKDEFAKAKADLESLPGFSRA
jgi:hypothetical protein